MALAFGAREAEENKRGTLTGSFAFDSSRYEKPLYSLPSPLSLSLKRTNTIAIHNALELLSWRLARSHCMVIAR